MQGYKNMMTKLKNSKSVREASDAFLLDFERPASMNLESTNPVILIHSFRPPLLVWIQCLSEVLGAEVLAVNFPIIEILLRSSSYSVGLKVKSVLDLMVLDTLQLSKRSKRMGIL